LVVPFEKKCFNSLSAPGEFGRMRAKNKGGPKRGQHGIGWELKKLRKKPTPEERKEREKVGEDPLTFATGLKNGEKRRRGPQDYLRWIKKFCWVKKGQNGNGRKKKGREKVKIQGNAGTMGVKKTKGKERQQKGLQQGLNAPVGGKKPPWLPATWKQWGGRGKGANLVRPKRNQNLRNRPDTRPKRAMAPKEKQSHPTNRGGTKKTDLLSCWPGKPNRRGTKDGPPWHGNEGLEFKQQEKGEKKKENFCGEKFRSQGGGGWVRI